MYILRDDNTFVPRGFLICQFYGNPTCFVWSDNELIKFEYTAARKPADKIHRLILPSRIKSVDNLTGRIFIICEPCGIYKLWHNMDFIVISKNGQAMGALFHEVLHIIDNCLYLDNLQNGTSTLLYVLSICSQKIDKLCTFPCNTENVSIYLAKSIWGNGEKYNNCCIIGIGNKVFKLVNGSLKILHFCESSIQSIIPIMDMGKISGLSLVLGTNTLVTVYPIEETLVFHTIHLKSEIVTLSAHVNQTLTDSMWIVYSDMSKLHFMRKYLKSEKIVQIRTEPINFIFMQQHNNMILGLTQKKRLLQAAILKIETYMLSYSNDFAPFNTNMIEGCRMILREFSNRLQELSQKKRLAVEQDKLNRINIYLKKQRIKFCPLMMIEENLNETFVLIDFQDILPKNTKILVNLQFKSDNIYSMQDVEESGTIIKIHIPDNKISDPLEISFDLVVFSEENQPWLIIEDYIIDPSISGRGKSQLTKTKLLPYMAR